MKLEVQTMEKINNVHSELREGNRRLDRLESQSEKLQSLMESFRTDFAKFAELSGQFALSERKNTLNKLEHELAYLTKGTQLLVASLRNVGNDIASIKNNISHVADITT